MSSAYLNKIRTGSRYPTFRGFIAIASILGYLAGVIVAGASLFAGQVVTTIGGVILGIVVVVASKIGQEVSLMVADVADATIDIAAKLTMLQEAPALAAESIQKPTPPVAFKASQPTTDALAKYPAEAQAAVAALMANGCSVVKQGDSSWEITQPSGLKMYARSITSLISLSSQILRSNGSASDN